jgi:hypothetical protein
MTGLGTSLPRIIDNNSSYIMDGSMIDCINEMNSQLNQHQGSKKVQDNSSIATSMINPMFTNDYKTINTTESQQFPMNMSSGQARSNMNHIRKMRQYSVETAGFMDDAP